MSAALALADPPAVRLVVRPHPLDESQRLELELPAGRSLAELLADRVPGGWRDLSTHWAVTVDGRPVPPERLDVTVPRPGALVTARLVPSDPATIAIIAAVLAKLATIAAGAVGLAAYAEIIGLVVYVGASAAGYAISARHTDDASSEGRTPQAQPFYSVTGSRNQMRPLGTIPQHYGTMRVTPDLVTLPQTRVDTAGVQTVSQLFCVGAGSYRFGTDDIRIGSQSVASLGSFGFNVYNVTNTTAPSLGLPAFINNVFEEQLGLQLRHVADEGSAEHVRTTVEDALGFDAQIVLPQGVWRISDSGRQQVAEIRIVVRYREVGETAWITTANETIRGFIVDRIVRNYHQDTSAGQYEVSVKIHAAMSRALYPRDRGGGGGSTTLTGDGIWLTLRSYLLGRPIVDERTEGFTFFGLSIEASQLLNGQLDTVNVEADRALPTWSEAQGWSDVALGFHHGPAYTSTRNPAWHMAHELRDAGVPDEEIDAERFLRFAQFCDAQGWRCDLQQINEAPLEDSLRVLGSAGQGGPVMRGSLFSVTWDEPKAPVAAFGPHNMAELELTQVPLEEVHAVQARFVNRERDYQLDEITVYFDGHTSDTAEVIRTQDVFNGLTEPALVNRFVHLEREKARLRNTIYSFRTDLTALVVEVGDVALLRYHGALLGDSETAVQSYTTKNAGAHVDELMVWPAVRIEAGREYSVRVRTRGAGADGGYALLTLPIVNPLTAGVQKLTALTVDGDVAVPTVVTDDSPAVIESDSLEGAPAFLGEPTDGEILVLSVELERHGFARIRAVDYAPSLFSFTAPPLEETDLGYALEQLLYVEPEAPALVAPPVDPVAEPDAPAQGQPYVALTGRKVSGYPEFRVHIPIAAAASDSVQPNLYRWQWRFTSIVEGDWQPIVETPAPVAELVAGPFLYGLTIASITMHVRIWAVLTDRNLQSAPLEFDVVIARPT